MGSKLRFDRAINMMAKRRCFLTMSMTSLITRNTGRTYIMSDDQKQLVHNLGKDEDLLITLDPNSCGCEG